MPLTIVRTGLIDAAAMARMAVGEALTNLMFVKITALNHIKCRGNWMWPAKFPGEGAAMYDAATAMSNMMIELGIAIDGGKDSLSMAAQVNNETVKAPGSLVISAYATVQDITCKVTPDIRHPGKSRLIFIDISGGQNRLGGSALAHVYGQLGDKSPDAAISQVHSAFVAVQTLLEKRLVSAGHDRSDGGLLITLLEMAFAGHCGLHIHLPDSADAIARLFAEELGVVIEVTDSHLEVVQRVLTHEKLTWHIIAETTVERTVVLSLGGKEVFRKATSLLHEAWEETSFHLELLQTEAAAVEQERKNLTHRHAPAYHLNVEMLQLPKLTQKPRVAIIREEGTNGDRELAAAFHLADFEVYDVAMADLEAAAASLSAFQGVAFAGGFSYADVMDSAKGWAGKIRMNPAMLAEFTAFYQRKNTFSLGICNGCQLMALLGWVPFGPLPDETQQPRFIRNACGRLESRWLTVRVEKSPAIMFKSMEGAVMGVWSVHGEGRAHFAHTPILTRVLEEKLAPLRFADDAGNITVTYPHNPSGSPHGIAALCSPDGRHLAMMPHPERAFLLWQWPYLPHGTAEGPSVWLRFFQNARQWCSEHPN